MPRTPNRKSPIAVLRESLDIDVETFASQLDCGLSTIQHVENFSRALRPWLADKISAFARVPTDWLYLKDFENQKPDGWDQAIEAAKQHWKRAPVLPLADAVKMSRPRKASVVRPWDQEEFGPKLKALYYTLQEAGRRSAEILRLLDAAAQELCRQGRIDYERVQHLEEQIRKFEREEVPPGSWETLRELEKRSPGFWQASRT